MKSLLFPGVHIGEGLSQTCRDMDGPSEEIKNLHGRLGTAQLVLSSNKANKTQD